MCRLLAVASRKPIDVKRHLDAFARICASSPEFQGHGWGCAVRRGDAWDRYRTVQPIWTDSYRPAGGVHLLVAHARSAFRNEDIVEENNMPFIDSDLAFIFNGELHGVRLPVDGRTGAQKIFRFIRNQKHGSAPEAVAHAMTILRRRTEHIRACNFIIAGEKTLIVHSLFNSEPDYFTMYRHTTPDERVVCSAPYETASRGWLPIPNGTMEEIPCSF